MDRSIVVIFRKWQGEIIALFPTEPGSVNSWRYCESYMQLGQHRAASIEVIMRESSPATELEYQAIKLELERMGYVLNVQPDYTLAMSNERWENWYKWYNS